MYNGFNVTLADRRKPWDVASWSEGQKPTSSQFLTSQEMLDVAGLAGWNVQALPMFTMDHDGQQLATKVYATVTAQGKVLGTGLSAGYRVLQTEDAFSFGDAIVDDGQAAWERAGSVRGGETVFGCMELKHLDVDVPGDDGGALTPYLLIVNSFGGWTPYKGVIAYIRPVCTNTFEAAYGTKTPYQFSIRHTGTLDGKLAMAREALGIAFRHTDEVRALTTKLATTSILDSQVQAIFEKVWPKTDAEAKAEDEDANVAAQVFSNYLTSQTVDGIRGTLWGALNAATEFVDHGQEYRPRGFGSDRETAALQLRGQQLLVGTAAKRKDAVLRELLKV